MNSINKIFSICLAISFFALALYFSPSNIPEGMFEDPKTVLSIIGPDQKDFSNLNF